MGSTDSNSSSVSNLSAVTPLPVAVPTGVEVKEQRALPMDDGKTASVENNDIDVQVPIIPSIDYYGISNASSRERMNGTMEASRRSSFRSLPADEHIPELGKVAEE